MDPNSWEFWIDVGGTFTDCLARGPDGEIHRLKLLSSGVFKGQVGAESSGDTIVDPLRQSDPPDFWVGWNLDSVNDQGEVVVRAKVVAYDSQRGILRIEGNTGIAAGSRYELRTDEESPVIAVRYLMGLTLAEPVPPVSLRLGSTRGTNALITRTGARTALVTTRGFGDILEIGYQARPRFFDLTIHKPPQLASETVEVNERVTHHGLVLRTLDETIVRQQLKKLRNSGAESLAICLLHADLHPDHEQTVARIAEEVGFASISRSSEVAPLPRIVARGDTTVVDAYLNPVLRGYVNRLEQSLAGSRIRILTSAGGLVAAVAIRGKDSILSGPAGGVIGFSRVAQAAGFDKAIGFDMGGTSTDVSRFDGQFKYEYETQKAGVRLVAPTLAIETVAAGGGSICRFDGVKLVVGPQSAGADPGPACYGRGGPLTLTDLNLLLGRIVAERFPFPLDRRAAEKRLAELVAEVTSSTGTQYELPELAAGLLRIANMNMASAIRLISVAQGANPADYVLVAFGGAAPQHACAVACELGVRRVLIHPDASLLSAYGIGLADVTRHRFQGVDEPVAPATLAALTPLCETLEQEAIEEVRAENLSDEQIFVERRLDVRYEGVNSCLTIAWPETENLQRDFEAEHRARYGYIHEGRPLRIAAVRVAVVGKTSGRLPASRSAPTAIIVAQDFTDSRFDGMPRQTAIFERRDLKPGNRVVGPALVVEDMSTTVIEPGWQCDVLSGGELLLEDLSKLRPGRGGGSPGTLIRNPKSEIRNQPDPVLLEIFNNLFAHIAEQMGVTLRNTASSVNVKERLDYSCAVFTADGRLVANAPHMPVHLGAMEETVRAVIGANPDLQPGDVVATNDPYQGGSHLPDITVVSPVHDPHSGELMFFTANRAHHAEIGGTTPGSMPPLARTLVEEGVLIRNFRLVSAGQFRDAELRDLLLHAPYPTRDVETNLADVAAQVAANRQGNIELLALVDRYSLPVVRAYMDHIQAAAERKVRQVLDRLPRGDRTFTDYLETSDGESVPISVRLTVHGSQKTPAATIDFTGTGPMLDGNLNANLAIVTAAVIYYLRLLIDEDIPLNHGVLKPIELVLPRGLLNPEPGATPETTPAVAGGNVETSQRIVDVLLGALSIAGASQGTMNNLIFGDATFGYYETICGGSGATVAGPGADAVQVHMTNTRSTDPEILERRYPVRLLEFAVRRGSGGQGRHRGGNGTIRRLEFLRPVTVSLVTERRGPHPPYGMAGGGPGALGRNILLHRDGRQIELPGIVQFDAESGDVLVIETPGGGGFGAPTS